MINTGLFFERQLNIDNIFFDGHTNENISYNVTPTNQPVEFGANVTDNVIVQPIQLSFSCYVSEFHPVSLNLRGAVNAFKRTNDALQVLYQTMVDRNVVSVVCNLGYFNNMLITSVPVSNEINTETTAFFTINLQQIYFVGEPQQNNPANDKYNGNSDRGSVQPMA